MIQESHPTGEQQTYDYYQQAEQGMERTRVQQQSELEMRKQRLIDKYIVESEESEEEPEEEEPAYEN